MPANPEFIMPPYYFRIFPNPTDLTWERHPFCNNKIMNGKKQRGCVKMQINNLTTFNL